MADALPEAPALVFPVPGRLFSNRAARFVALSSNNLSALGPYLALMAELAAWQAATVESFAVGLALPADAGVFPLSGVLSVRHPEWRGLLRNLAGTILPSSQGIGSQLERLSSTDDTGLDRLAAAVLAFDVDGETGSAPFIAAVFQFIGAMAAAQLGDLPLESPEGHACPACGSPPVASLLQAGNGRDGLRYAVCGVCQIEWRRPRLACLACQDSQHLSYHAVEGGGGAVKAETCDGCGAYHKIINLGMNPAADVLADDLASLGLDLLLGEKGYQRLGFNPLFWPGKS